MSHDLLYESFLHTTYIVHSPSGPIRLRIGTYDPAIDLLLDRYGAAEWAFITAWNPDVLPHPRQENLARNEELRAMLLAGGFDPIAAEGAGDDGSWEPEESFWVAGLAGDRALELGRRFRQAAIVTGLRSHPPRLRWCRQDLPGV